MGECRRATLVAVGVALAIASQFQQTDNLLTLTLHNISAALGHGVLLVVCAFVFCATVGIICRNWLTLYWWLAVTVLFLLAFVPVYAEVSDGSCNRYDRSLFLRTAYLKEYVLLGGIFVLATGLFRTKGWRLFLNTSFVSVIFLNVIYCMIQYLGVNLGAIDNVESWRTWIGSMYSPIDSSGVHLGSFRLTGLVGNPNNLGVILCMTWPCLLFRRSAEMDGSFTMTLRAAFIVISVVVVFLTYSRAAYLGVVVQLALVTWIVFTAKDAKNRQLWATNLLLVVGAIILAFLAISAVADRFQAIVDTADRSVLNRLYVYAVAGCLIILRPVTGYGPTTFDMLYNCHYKLDGVGYDFSQVHSAALSFLMEFGVLGAVLFVFPVVVSRPRCDSRHVWIMLCVCGATPGLILSNPGSRVSVIYPLLLLFCNGLGQSSSPFGGTNNHCKSRRLEIVIGIMLLVWLCFWLQPVEVSNHPYDFIDSVAGYFLPRL